MSSELKDALSAKLTEWGLHSDILLEYATLLVLNGKPRDTVQKELSEVLNPENAKQLTDWLMAYVEANGNGRTQPQSATSSAAAPAPVPAPAPAASGNDEELSIQLDGLPEDETAQRQPQRSPSRNARRQNDSAFGGAARNLGLAIRGAASSTTSTPTAGRKRSHDATNMGAPDTQSPTSTTSIVGAATESATSKKQKTNHAGKQPPDQTQPKTDDVQFT
ncbi:hypothetical protein HK097_001546, partial [Rhizophlyctis rosea]